MPVAAEALPRRETEKAVAVRRACGKKAAVRTEWRVVVPDIGEEVLERRLYTPIRINVTGRQPIPRHLAAGSTM